MIYTGNNDFGSTLFNGVGTFVSNGTHVASDSISVNHDPLDNTRYNNNINYNKDNYYTNDIINQNYNSNSTAMINDGNAMNKILNVDRIDVLQHIINTLNGKDKLAKTLKHLLDLLRYLLSTKSSILIKNKWANRITSSIIKNLIDKLTFVSIQLTTYRYILRFGNSPFLIVKFIQKWKRLLYTDKDFNSNNNNDWKRKSFDLLTTIFKESLFKELFSIYFSVCDEILLLNRLRVWKHAKLERFISRQEIYSWQLDILLNLKDDISELQELKRQSLEYSIEKNIREVNNNLYPEHFSSEGDMTLYHSCLNALNNKLVINAKRQRILKLDILRLIFDALANSTDLFKLRVSLGTYSGLSLCSSIISLIKLWVEAKQKISITSP